MILYDNYLVWIESMNLLENIYKVYTTHRFFYFYYTYYTIFFIRQIFLILGWVLFKIFLKVVLYDNFEVYYLKFEC